MESLYNLSGFEVYENGNISLFTSLPVPVDTKCYQVEYTWNIDNVIYTSLYAIGAHALYSKIDDSSDELESGPTRKKN